MPRPVRSYSKDDRGFKEQEKHLFAWLTHMKRSWNSASEWPFHAARRRVLFKAHSGATCIGPAHPWIVFARGSQTPPTPQKWRERMSHIVFASISRMTSSLATWGCARRSGRRVRKTRTSSMLVGRRRSAHPAAACSACRSLVRCVLQ